jgi:hypothetical protein
VANPGVEVKSSENDIINTLAPKQFYVNLNVVPYPTSDPNSTQFIKDTGTLLNKLHDTWVALANLKHLSCPSCGVRNPLFTP